MNKGNLNKLVTNYPVELTPEEVENLSLTLSAVRTAGGGGGEGKIYTGVGFVSVNNTNNTISLTNEANEKINQPIPTKVSDLTDSASYQTVAGMDEYLTKTSASENLAPLSITADIESLKSASSNWNKVSDKLDTTAFSDVSGNFLTAHQSLNEYATKEYANNASANAFNQATALIPDVSNFITKDVNDLTNYYPKTQTSSDSELSTEFAKYATTTYVDGKDPVLIGDSNVTATSSTVDGHTQWNLAVNVTPVVTNTKLVGDNCVTAHTTTNSGEWLVGLEQTAYEAIDSIGGIATDVTTLKNASAGWNDVTAKLDKSIYSNASGKWENASNVVATNSANWNAKVDQSELDDYLTKAQYGTDSATFALKTQLDDYYKKTETSSKTELSTEFAKYVTTSTLDTVSSTLNDDIEYVSGQVDNKVDKPTEGNKIFVYQTTGTTTSGWEEIPIEFDLSGRNFAIGVENEFDSNGGGTDILLQGYQNSGTYVDFAQGIHNSAYQYAISQGYQNKANYESMAQGYINTAINIALAQGSTNSANYQAFAQGILNKANYDSLAQGHSNSAVDQSIAQGLENTAYHYSFAQGFNNVADMQSFAQGADNRASEYSQTIGHNLIASGFNEDDYYYGLFAIGGYNATTSNALFVVGNGSSYNGTPTRSDAFVIYRDGSVSAKGDISANGVKLGAGGGSLTLPVNVGTGNDVSQTSAIGAIGNNCSAGTKSFAFSYKGATAYENSFVVNDDNIAGHNSFAWGWGSTADVYSMAGGNNVSAYNHSFVLAQGDSTAKSQANNYSIAFGNAVTANNWSYVFGRGLNFSGSDDATTGIGALVVGGWNNTTADALFVLANGTSNNSRNDAMVVYRNGSVNIGNTNTINGNNFYVEGYHNTATSAGATSRGYGYTHIEGGYNTSNGGQYNHIEGEANEVYGDRIHIQGSRNIFSAGDDRNTWGISIEGILNSTTANVSEHNGLLKVIGNGVYTDSQHQTRSDAYILYRDGTVKAKDFIAGGNTLSANYPIPKTIPNTADNTLKVQRMFVCTSDNDIIAHVNAGLAEGEGCVFFRVGN